MSVIIPEIDDIYFPQTKEYFREIMSSYANGNYRSATVMLYSVAVCDIMLKLKELKDMYNDSVANCILEEIDKTRADASSKSRWEWDLIDKVYKKTSLLSLEAYTHIRHLYDDRNFSAHPSLNENYELVSPSQETTIANIKNILCDILVKPPIFIKNVISLLTDDLQERKETFYQNYDVMRNYLNNRYFSKMSDSMKIATFKALWKFCFRSPENEDCMNNLAINRGALQVLTQGMQKDIINQMIAAPQICDASDTKECITNLIKYLACFPILYSHMQDHVKSSINRVITENPELKAYAWFMYPSLKDHIAALENDDSIELSEKTAKTLELCYFPAGCKDMLLSFYVTYYGKSRSYDSANQRFSILKKHLNDLSASQLVSLIALTDANNQIYERRKALSDNAEVYKIAVDKLGKDFDFSAFPNFKFKEETKETAFTDITADDLPF